MTGNKMDEKKVVFVEGDERLCEKIRSSIKDKPWFANFIIVSSIEEAKKAIENVLGDKKPSDYSEVQIVLDRGLPLKNGEVIDCFAGDSLILWLQKKYGKEILSRIIGTSKSSIILTRWLDEYGIIGSPFKKQVFQSCRTFLESKE